MSGSLRHSSLSIFASPRLLLSPAPLATMHIIETSDEVFSQYVNITRDCFIPEAQLPEPVQHVQECHTRLNAITDEEIRNNLRMLAISSREGWMLRLEYAARSVATRHLASAMTVYHASYSD